MSYESDDKMVSHPDHYNSGKYEVIDIIEEFTKGLSGLEAVCTGNAIKYILRWKKKGGYQDLEKAMWYIQHMLDKHEEAEHKPLNVVIHKLANGNYAIENDLRVAKEFTEAGKIENLSDEIPVKEVHHCGTCEHQWSTKGDCPRMNKKRLMGGIGSTSDMIACDQWELTRGCNTCKFEKTYKGKDPCLTCFNNAEKGNEYSMWEPKDAPDAGEKIDQEESDLSVAVTKSSSGVYMPDGKPWEKRKHQNGDCCLTCAFGDKDMFQPPCDNCGALWTNCSSKWTPKDAKNLAEDDFNNAGAP